MDTVKKWLLDLKSEMPMFWQLCRTIAQLLKKLIRKEDTTSEKTQAIALQKQTVKVQIAVGVCAVVLLFVMFRGCGKTGQSDSGVIHADGDLRKFLMEQQVAQQKQEAESRERERVAEEQRKAEEAKMEADEKRRAQKHEELGAWYRTESKKLEETKKAKYNELEKSKSARAHDILVEHNWPQIKFPPLGDITIAEPLPEKYKSYTLTECPISITNVPIFTSMRIDGVGADNGTVKELWLYGRGVSMTPDMAIRWMRVLSKKLDETWGVKHANLGEDQVFPDGGCMIAPRSWEGLPRWGTFFQCQAYKTGDGQIANFELHIDGNELRRLVDAQLEKEFREAVRKLEDDMNVQKERLEEELRRRQNEVK